MSCVFRKKLLQFALLIALIALSTTSDGVTQAFLAKCLPADIKLSDIVEATSARYASGRASGVHKITVEDKLNELKATCSDDNKLVDGNGRQIVFYHLIGCWGYPPPDYQELLQKQQREIERLAIMGLQQQGADFSSRETLRQQIAQGEKISFGESAESVTGLPCDSRQCRPLRW